MPQAEFSELRFAEYKRQNGEARKKAMIKRNIACCITVTGFYIRLVSYSIAERNGNNYESKYKSNSTESTVR